MSVGGIFGPGSVTWRVNGETAMILGGGRALVLQTAHPLIGAAVDEHSRYRADRWGRLKHTLRTMGEIVFGDDAAAAASAERMRRAHARFHGTVRDGRAAGCPYRATDPALVLWVWATLVDTSLLVYDRFVQPLGAADAARYYAEQLRLAELCGVPAGAWPSGLAAFRAYVDGVVRETLEPTPAARDACALVLNPLGLPRAAAPLAALTALPTAGLLPPRLRAELGVAWTPARERALWAAARASRASVRRLPRRLRRVRSARGAEDRVAAAGRAPAARDAQPVGASAL